MVILNTDHMGVLERREQPSLGTLLHRLAELPPSDMVTTVISYEEQMRGWMAYLARARSMACSAGISSSTWTIIPPRRWRRRLSAC